MSFTVILFYTFIEINNPKVFMENQRELCDNLGIKGRMIIGKEGINGTLEGTDDAIAIYMKALKKDSRFKNMSIKTSEGTGAGFPKLTIKVRNEVVTLGAGYINPASPSANEITAEELDRMYESNEDFVLLDLRNDYEIASGAFEKSVNPGLSNFRELPAKLSTLKDLKDKKVVTVCTGGIRCEKATKLMKKEGFTDLYQLKDGIHSYMQQFPGKRFKGTLFVFDNRMVTDVTKIIEKEIIGKCKYCGVASETYYSDDSKRPSVKVISCERCFELHKNELRVAVTL